MRYSSETLLVLSCLAFACKPQGSRTSAQVTATTSGTLGASNLVGDQSIAVDPKVFAELDMHAINLVCVDAATKPCTAKNTADKLTIKGDAKLLYTVNLHVSGQGEGMRYQGGNAVENGGGLYLGGKASEGKSSIFRIVVDKPAQTYYLNATQGSANGYRTWDYEASIEAAGDAILTLESDAQSDGFIPNPDVEKIFAPGVGAVTQAQSEGQFFYLEVTGVSAQIL